MSELKRQLEREAERPLSISWITGDTHLGHDNIIKYCKRSFMTAKHMDEVLIGNWNSLVREHDIVYHIGDLSFGNQEGYLDRLNGKVILLKGNHDPAYISRIMSMNYHGAEGHTFSLIHDPSQDHLIPEGTKYILHGHVHDLWKRKEEEGRVYFNVGVDVWDFKPITLGQAMREAVNKELFDIREGGIVCKGYHNRGEHHNQETYHEDKSSSKK